MDCDERDAGLKKIPKSHSTTIASTKRSNGSIHFIRSPKGNISQCQGSYRKARELPKEESLCLPWDAAVKEIGRKKLWRAAGKIALLASLYLRRESDSASGFHKSGEQSLRSVPGNLHPDAEQDEGNNAQDAV